MTSLTIHVRTNNDIIYDPLSFMLQPSFNFIPFRVFSRVLRSELCTKLQHGL